MENAAFTPLVDTSQSDPIDIEQPAPPTIKPDLFGGWLADMIRAEAKATETPPELAAIFALTVLATCVQKKYRICVKQGYFEPVNIWGVVALDPGNRKSAVMKDMTRPLLKWEEDKANELEPEIIAIEERRATSEAQIASLRGRAAKAKGDSERRELNDEIIETRENMEEVPSFPKIWAQDITPESLGAVMSEHGEQMSILSTEGGVFDIMGGRYSNGVPNLDLFLQAHSGDPVKVDRGSRPPVFLKDPALTFGLSPQPEVLRGLASRPGFRGRGLLVRYLYAIPPSPLGFRCLDTDPVPHAISKEYAKNITALLNLEAPVNKQGEKISTTLILSEGAKTEWMVFAAWIEPQLQPMGTLSTIRDWASKLAGSSARIAALLHCAEYAQNSPGGHEISAHTMKRAVLLSKLFIEHAQVVFDMMGADSGLNDARKVWEWVKSNRLRSFTARDCQQALKGSFKRAKDIAPAFAALIEFKYIHELKEDEDTLNKKRGRPSKIFTVHEKLCADWE